MAVAGRFGQGGWSMEALSPIEAEVAELIVRELNLQSVDPGSIGPTAPLFREGLGLDSIDALELALAISQRYGIQLRLDDSNNRRIFASVRALADYIAGHRTM